MRRLIVCLSFAATLFCIVLNGCQNENELKYSRYFVNGKQLYEQHCENCHSKDGQGLGELIPPLTDTVFLSKNRKFLSCFIKFGLTDSIRISNIDYQGKMPAEDHLTNIDIAQVITYVTNSFGNKQGLYDVDAAARDLANCK